jgi:hypothetical protein
MFKNIGMIPGLNHIGKTNRNVMMFLPLKRDLDKEYAAVTENNIFTNVPAKVIYILFKYPETRLSTLNARMYASKVKFTGHIHTLPEITSLPLLKEAISTYHSGYKAINPIAINTIALIILNVFSPLNTLTSYTYHIPYSVVFLLMILDADTRISETTPLKSPTAVATS